MRFIIYGLGAIGGGIAARLALSGHDVVGIARGAQLEAVRKGGLRFRSPVSDEVARFPCVGGPEEISFGDDDVILLAMKTQHTLAALEALETCGVRQQPVVCAQNGVANERMALRLFENVYAMVIMMPAEFLTPGEVIASGAPKPGVFNIGRYPRGVDDTATDIVAALNKAGFAAFVEPEVMAGKYGKLLMNLRNVVEAALGREEAARFPLVDAARAEAEVVLKAADIACAKDYRHDHLMQIREVAGVKRTGSSSTQSLLRGTGSIETNYLNGEIVLLGRLHGVPAPVNAFLCDLGRRMVAEKIAPGSMSAGEMDAAFEAYLRERA